MTYAKTLQNIGLKKQEAEVYLACLKLGMAKVSDLAKEVNIPRTSIYVYIKSLLERGYLEKSKKYGVEYFIPVEPQYILKETKEKVKDFSNIVPQLEKFLDFIGKKPKIEYFDTKQGLFNLYEKMLQLDYKHVFYLIESGEAIRQNLEKMGWDFWYKWEKKFLEKKVITQGILTKDAIPIIQSAPEKVKNIFQQRPATVRIIDEKEFPFSINLYLIYPSHIFVIVSQENFILMIENKSIYNSLLTLYKVLFEKGTPFNIREILNAKTW